MKKKGILPLRERLGYGIGTFGYCLESSVLTSYMVLFCTDILGLAPGLLGTILMIPKILDVIGSFLIMNYVDRTRTKFGTYRPWLLMAVPLGIAMYAIFLNPAFLRTDGQKLLWVTVIYFLDAVLFESSYWCPHTTLSGVMSPEEADRTSLSAVRSVFESMSGLFVSCSLLPMLSVFGTGYRDPTGWRYAIAIFAVIGMISGVGCFALVRERVAVPEQEKGEKLELFRKLKAMFRNRAFFSNSMIICLLVLLLFTYYTLLSYHCIYNLGHEEWISYISACSVAGGMAGSLLAPSIANKISNRKTIWLGAGLTAISAIIFSVAKTLPGMFAFCLCKDFGTMFIYVCTFARVPEIAEKIMKTETNLRQGVIFGVTASLQKLATALGGFIGTTLLSLGGYNAALTVQSELTKTMIRWGVSGVFLLAAAGMLVLSITEKQEIKQISESV